MKGRPPTIERIAALEAKVDALHTALQDVNTRLLALEQRAGTEPITAPNVRLPFRDQYQPIFEKWGANGR